MPVIVLPVVLSLSIRSITVQTASAVFCAAASESSLEWAFVEGYRRAEEEGRAAAFFAWAEYTGESDYDAFDDAYRGEAQSEEDYAYEYVSEHALLSSIPDDLRCYFDYEAYARDLFSGGLVFVDGYVFSN